jgi:hypothetical protein
VRLWRALTVTEVRIRVKVLMGKELSFIFCEAPHALHSPVLVHTSVAHLKHAIHKHEGLLPQEMVLIRSGSTPLKHERAPLAAYVWDILRRNSTNSMPEVRLDMVLRMSTGGCSAEPARPSELAFDHIRIITSSAVKGRMSSVLSSELGWEVYMDEMGPWFYRKTLQSEEWFFEHTARSEGWKRHTDPRSRCSWWVHHSGRWFFDPRQ